MRGEEYVVRSSPRKGPGSPPRARGRVLLLGRRFVVPGITPACAGKRVPVPTPMQPKGDHPRVRGEEVGTENPGR